MLGWMHIINHTHEIFSHSIIKWTKRFIILAAQIERARENWRERERERVGCCAKYSSFKLYGYVAAILVATTTTTIKKIDIFLVTRSPCMRSPFYAICVPVSLSITSNTYTHTYTQNGACPLVHRMLVSIHSHVCVRVRLCMSESSSSECAWLFVSNLSSASIFVLCCHYISHSLLLCTNKYFCVWRSLSVCSALAHKRMAERTRHKTETTRIRMNKKFGFRFVFSQCVCVCSVVGRVCSKCSQRNRFELGLLHIFGVSFQNRRNQQISLFSLFYSVQCSWSRRQPSCGLRYRWNGQTASVKEHRPPSSPIVLRRIDSKRTQFSVGVYCCCAVPN